MLYLSPEQLQDMAVKVTTEVAEVEATKAPMDEEGQVQTDIVFTAMMLSVVVYVVGIVPGVAAQL